MSRTRLLTFGNRALSLVAVGAAVFSFLFPALSLSQALVSGPTAFAPVSGSSIDSVNLPDGSLQVAIPLWSIKQRGNLSLSFSLRYRSSGVGIGKICSQTNPYGSTCPYPFEYTLGSLKGTQPGNGSVYVADNITVALTTIESTDASGEYLGYYWQLTTPDGTVHKLARTGTTTFRSTDGTGWAFDEKALILISEDGLRYVFQCSQAPCYTPNLSHEAPYPNIIVNYVEDTNGNQIGVNYSTSTVQGITYYSSIPQSYTDSFGRVIQAPASAVAASTTTGCTGPTPILSAATWSLPGFAGSVPFTFCYGSVPIHTDFFTENPNYAFGGTGYDKELSGTFSYLQSVVLPDQSTWTFSYQNPNSSTINYGDLTQITSPTGGTIAYSWLSAHSSLSLCSPTSTSAFPINFTSKITSRTLNSGQAGSTGVWSYAVGSETVTSNSRSITTTVTDPTGAYVVHSITGLGNSCSYYDTEEQAFNSSGVLLKTETHGYQYQTDIDNPAAFGTVVTPTTSSLVLEDYPYVMNVLPTQNTMTWANGATKQTTYSYANTFTAVDLNGNGSYTIPYGVVSTESHYDYGNGSPGALLSQRTTSYYAFTNPSALANNLLTIPVSITDTDETTNLTQTTTYGYDAGTLGSGAASGAGWNPTPLAGAARGNQTSITRYWDTANTYLTTTKTYYNTGLIASIAEPPNSAITGSLTTTYSYSSAYDGAYVTQLTDPQGNSITYSYDLGSGLLTGTVDQNHISSAYTYYPYMKLETVTRQGGDHNLASSVSYVYPSPTVVQRTTGLNSTTSMTDTTTYDGLGRVVQTQHADPEGNEFQDTAYDPVGRVLTKSTPYRSKTDTTSYGLTTYTYDGLSRPYQVFNSDSTYITYSYAGSTTQTTNESNGSTSSQHLSRVDGLGRLLSECEIITSATPAQMGGDTPSSCGLEIAGNGFLTSYTQTLRGTTQSIQGAQTRRFTYDSLGRLTSSMNPEAGYLQYAYDPDGNVISKVAPAPNSLQGGSSTVTTTLTYDNMHHLISKTYSGTGASSTPTATYVYGQTSVNGRSIENPVGRLTSEYTTLGTTTEAMTIYSYDTDGRIASHYQCVQTNCPSSFQDVEYHYDGAGNVINFSTPQTGYANTYDSAGHLTAMIPTWSVNATHPSTLVSPHYAPNGNWSTTSFGNSTSETYNYQPRWLTGMSVASATSPLYSYTVTHAADTQITRAVDSINGIWNYTYDDFNRLITAQEVNTSNAVVNGLGWNYDRYGNRWQQNVTAGSGVGNSLNFDTATNQAASLLAYDAAGNVTNDTFHAYVYDAENRIANVDGAMSYIYDAEGRRVGKFQVANSTVVSPETGSIGKVVIGGVEGVLQTVASHASGTITVTGADASNNVCTTIWVYVPSEHQEIPETTCKLVPDTGSLSVTIDGFTATASYGSGVADATIAQTLVAGFSAQGSPVTAVQNGSSFTLTTVATGTGANYPITLSNGGGYTISDPNNTLTGGQTAGTTYDAGSMTVSITNSAVSPSVTYTTAPVSWGQGTSTLTLGNQISTAISAAAGAIVSASYSNGSVSFTSIDKGASTNYAVSVSVSDTTPGFTSNPSFTFQTTQMTGGAAAVLGAGAASGTVYVVSPAGDVIDELDNGSWTRTEFYAGGHHIATANASTIVFIHSDWLGTERARTNMAGALCQTTSSQPFGDGVVTSTPLAVTNCSLTPDFLTGKPRDSESNLDDFGARYLSSQFGRWMSPDWSAAPAGVPYAAFTNPQSLNLYAYVGNDPIDGEDPDGHRGNFTLPVDFGNGGEANLDGPYSVDALQSGIAGEVCVNCTTSGTEEAQITNQQSQTTPASAPPPPAQQTQTSTTNSTKSTQNTNCFADLMYRPVTEFGVDTGETHSFWYVGNATGDEFVIDGGPSQSFGRGTLNDWITSGTVGHYADDNVRTADLSFASGTQPHAQICSQVASMIKAANSYPNNTITYHGIDGPNSNSFAHWVGVHGGFDPPSPPHAINWNSTVPVP